MTPLLAMVRANVLMSLRNRAALFWNLAFPALFIVIFGVVFGRGTSVEFDVGVAGPESAFREEVAAALRENPELRRLHRGGGGRAAGAGGGLGGGGGGCGGSGRGRVPAGDALLQRDGGADGADRGGGGAADAARRGRGDAAAGDRAAAGDGARGVVH